ncbi:hypothetical protein F5Y07DRAFT_398814 [Xylaria sp. FL0933]|nr:hypothetical protein F5Y07DRAFT_398814 [Xylaria sp. FL0933]
MSSHQLEPPAVELQMVIHPESSRDFGDTQDPDSIHADQLLYNTYEYELYSPAYFVGQTENRLQKVEPFSSIYSGAVELPGDTAWPVDDHDDSRTKRKADRREWHDSELGFLEHYILTHIISTDPLKTILCHGEGRSNVKAEPKELDETSKPRFDVEEDVSDTENPWEEASDQSESNHGSQADTQSDRDGNDLNIGSMGDLGVDGIKTLVDSQSESADPTLLSSSTMTESSIQNDTTATEEKNVSVSLYADKLTTLPTIEEQTCEVDGDQGLPPPKEFSESSLN